MKRTYQLTKGKHAPARVIESIKSNINKYVKRERRKELPDDLDFWDFECKVGAAADAATTVHLSAIGKAIDAAAAASTTETIYVEIETHGKKRKSSKSKSNTDKTPAVETPAVEPPAVETPAVETPAVESKPSVDVSPSSEVVSNSNSPASDGVDGSVH